MIALINSPKKSKPSFVFSFMFFIAEAKSAPIPFGFEANTPALILLFFVIKHS